MAPSTNRYRLLQRMRTLLRHRGGVAASEFALLLPFMLLVLLGTVEVGNAVLLQRKVTAATQTAADLAAQSTALDDDDIENLFDAMDAIIEPYNAGLASYVLQSVVMEDDEEEIDWVDVRGDEDADPDEDVTLPPGLIAEGGSVIVARVSYAYTPLFADLIFVGGSFTMSDTAFLRPRRTDQITRL